MPINLVYGALKTGDLKNDIPDPAHRSWGGFLVHQVLTMKELAKASNILHFSMEFLVLLGNCLHLTIL